MIILTVPAIVNGMYNPTLSTNPDIEPKIPEQTVITTKTPTVAIITTSVIFTLIGATGMWGYQKISQTAQTPSIASQEADNRELTSTITTPATTTSIEPTLANTKQALQEYSSATNPYTFSYPQSTYWQVFETNGVKGASVSVSCDTCTDAKVDMFQVTPVIFTSIEEYIQKDTLTTNKTAITLNGLPAVRGVQSGSEEAGGSFVVVFIVKDKKGYLLQQRYAGLYNKTQFSEIPQVEPDMLASFKFSDM